MADKKISQLTAASTPLAGTEVLPIVQSGATKKVTALELTGTTVDTFGNVTIPEGNLVQGTAAKGINFTANTPAAGMTSQLLNWYEEGAFTPTLTYETPGTLSVSYSQQTGRYTRIGRVVYFTIDLRLSAFTKGTASGNLLIAGLPFSSIAQEFGASLWTFNAPLPTTAGVYPIAAVLFANVQLLTIQNNGAYGAFPDPDADSQYKINGSYTV